MTRIEHFQNPDAPAANSLIPAASAVVVDPENRVLLLKRTDNEFWTIPGGAMEPGETIKQTMIRETREETGIEVRPLFLVGIYSDPRHVVEYSDGEVRQQFSVCFRCEAIGGDLSTSEESAEVGYFNESAMLTLPIHESIRRRIRDCFDYAGTPFID
ncbi:MAG: NUDIX domain-containing protein [Actinobacteria bacterium]|nr:NUDIX domain-containing protein [Actinomycetota bacterium]